MIKVKNNIFKVFVSALVALLLVLSLKAAIFSSPKSEKTYAESQQETTAFLQSLASNSAGLATSYLLTQDYVLDGGDQLTTDFCWLFSSLKCLESSYMLQEGEYYNFSETGMAYLNYVAKKANGQSTFNTTGNLLTFYTLAKQYGLVMENDVSNDLLLDINEANYENYSFISGMATKNLIENVKVVSFGENSYFTSLSYNSQILTMKAFVKKYGALFLAFGDGDGIVFKTNGLSEYSYTPEGHEYDEAMAINRHAVCIIGWNEKGFIALNSWGNGEDKYETFCVPYEITKSRLNELMATVKGFVVDDAGLVEIRTGSENRLKNIYNIGEDVSFEYLVNPSINLSETKVEITKGSEDVTFNFDIEFDSSNSVIKIKDRFINNAGSSGGYVISFFENDLKFAAESFLILAGVEVSSVALERNVRLDEYDLESLSQTNSYLSAKTTATYMLSPYSKYRLKLTLSDFAKCKFLASDEAWDRFKDANGLDALFEVSTIKVQTISSGVASWKDTGLLVGKYIDYDINSFEFVLPIFSGSNAQYQNKLISFDIKINSTTLSEEQQVLTFLCFIGSGDGVNTNQNHEVHYELDGGKNSSLNITNFPNYQINSNMTRFILNAPTKSGYEFLGWYSDSSFTKQIFNISSEFIGDLVLYAKWDSADIEEYLLTGIEISALKNSDNESKNIYDDIVYGDIVSFRYIFSPQGELIKYNYSARLVAYYIYDGEKFYIDALNNYVVGSSLQTVFNLGYPDLVFGAYTLVIEANIIINNVASLEASARFSFDVEKRSVVLEMSQLSAMYDGNLHFPIVAARQGDVLEHDVGSFSFNYSISPQRNVGNYTIRVYLLNDNYKISDQSTSECEFNILPRKLDIIWGNTLLVYNAQKQAPLFEIQGLINGDYCTVSLKNNDFINVGQYVAEVDSGLVSNNNYYVETSKINFDILPAKIEIKLNDVTEKLRVAPQYRTGLSYEISGDIFSGVSDERKQQIIDSLDLKLASKGLSASEFGKYDISATISNSNFDATIISGTYNLTAPYKVFYKLPDGTILEEEVAEGEQPNGVSRDEYGYTIFQSLEYSMPLYGDGTSNLHITVTVKDYTIYFIVGFVVAALVVTYLVITRKQRRNKVS